MTDLKLWVHPFDYKCPYCGHVLRMHGVCSCYGSDCYCHQSPNKLFRWARRWARKTNRQIRRHTPLAQSQ